MRQTALVGKLLENPRLSIYKAAIAVGYSKAHAIHPKDIIQAKGFQELLAERLGDDKLTRVHNRLLKTKRIDHMTFPLSLSDEDIEVLITSVNGTLRKIVHGDMAKHAYWWIDDAKAREGALKLAYQVRGKLDSATPPAAGDQYNLFIQQNNGLDPNTPEARKLVDVSIDAMMSATKRQT